MPAATHRRRDQAAPPLMDELLGWESLTAPIRSSASSAPCPICAVPLSSLGMLIGHVRDTHGLRGIESEPDRSSR